MPLDLRKLHTQQARAWRKEAAYKLLRRQGVRGQTLRRKVIDNGRPLGFGDSSGGVPALLRRGKIRAMQSGFDVTLPDKAAWFHFGRPGVQVPRPILGFSRRQQRRMARDLGREVRRAGKRAGLFR